MLEDSPEGATADRSPRRAAGRAARVAVPLAFFCTLFFRHRKKSVSAPWDGKSHSRAGVGASCPRQGFAYGKVDFSRRLHGLSSRQTIGAARTAVRSAGCLPELRVISAFGGQPTGLTFLSVPPCTPSGHRKKVCSKPRLRRSRRVSSPRQGNRPSSGTLRCKRGLSAYTSYPFGLSKEKRERPMRRQAPNPRRSLRVNPRLVDFYN